MNGAIMSEASRTLLVAALSLAAGFTWQGLRTAAIPVSSPDRLVAELRLAQVAALGFGLVAASTIVRDPRQALTIVALAFAAHAVLDVAHRPGVLPEDVVPRWYSVGCAIFNVYIGAIAYWPMLRR